MNNRGADQARTETVDHYSRESAFMFSASQRGKELPVICTSAYRSSTPLDDRSV